MERLEAGMIDSRGISNTVWAYAVLAFANPPLLDAIASDALRRISDFGVQGLANTTWPPRKVSAAQLLVMTSTDVVCTQYASCFTGQECSNTAWVFAPVCILSSRATSWIPT
eukprot:gnl/TRDRNA2_/TRDRNA2_171105_c1_seq1.p1 gnl/TRDRNA2_/TRDRNA2_171105_c1~~gnl/TRDRNA2_/TRDRNA2_171105_c1_seq1.p1  ORF type:complete len:112 (+),score=10.47 gnl/TRDRNA2_/TRDRNA2_171105_c1_seq1:314-649(+)